MVNRSYFQRDECKLLLFIIERCQQHIQKFPFFWNTPLSYVPCWILAWFSERPLFGGARHVGRAKPKRCPTLRAGVRRRAHTHRLRVAVGLCRRFGAAGHAAHAGRQLQAAADILRAQGSSCWPNFAQRSRGVFRSLDNICRKTLTSQLPRRSNTKRILIKQQKNPRLSITK